VFLSHRDSHPTVGAYSQAHLIRDFVAEDPFAPRCYTNRRIGVLGDLSLFDPLLGSKYNDRGTASCKPETVN